MISAKAHKISFIDITTAMFIFLFVYAAASKLIDYQKFEVQIGQSPMLTHFAGWFAWLIPSLEIIICFFLAVPNLQIIGLYGFFCLMIIFTTYIIAITNFSEYIPCSCGGVLQHMNWTQHLVFNIFFVILSTISILIYNRELKKNFIAIESGHTENL